MARAEAPPGENLQGQPRPRVFREAGRRCWTGSEPARACHRSVRRREEPDSGSGPHSARSAADDGVLRHHAHDYKRNGAATLFATLNALNGEVTSMCDDRHRHQDG